jgi:hypothetical protein
MAAVIRCIVVPPAAVVVFVDVVAIDTIGELPALMSLDLQLGDN